MLIACADGSIHVTLPAFHGVTSAAACNAPPKVLLSLPNPFIPASPASSSSSILSPVTIVAWLGYSSIAAATTSGSKVQTLLISHFAMPLPHVTSSETPVEWKGQSLTGTLCILLQVFGLFLTRNSCSYRYSFTLFRQFIAPYIRFNPFSPSDHLFAANVRYKHPLNTT
jgi:hypothetical protein